MQKEQKLDRIQYAKELFKSGYNCSQSVFLAFSDIYNVPKDLALRMSAPFGGGIGRMRQTCGAACGMFMLAGLERGALLPQDKDSKTATYALVQELAAEFKKRNGSLICGELLGLSAVGSSPVAMAINARTSLNAMDPVPEERTPQYYAKRPCVQMVEEACRIYQEYLDRHKEYSDKSANLEKE